jgi:SAM-dependent methyltransferase
MSDTRESQSADRFEFYAPQYSRFESEAAAEARREVYGEDMGQQGWRSLDEQALIAGLIRESSLCEVLDVGCGSGGPSLALVQQTKCRLTGVDVEASGVEHARRQTLARGLSDMVTFEVVDCNERLPFPDAVFDVVVCIDAVLHLKNRFRALADWSRLVRPQGRVIFTDAAVVTGPISIEELNVRASQGAFVLVPPGVNERAITASGLILCRCEDRTQATAAIAGRWHDVRERRAFELQKEEGPEWFARRQRFLAMTAKLAATGRLSRFLYVAERVT